MSILAYSVLWLLLFLLVLSAILFALKRANRLSVPHKVSLADLANLIAVLFAVFSLAFAIASFEDAAKSSQQQQKTLDLSKDALEKAVAIAKGQQDELTKSVALSEDQTKRSQEQVRLLTAASDALRSHLDLAIKQRREEELRAAQKPKIRIVFVTATGDDERFRTGSNPFFFDVGIYNNGTANLIEPQLEVNVACQKDDGDFVATYISRWDPPRPLSEQLGGPVLIHDEHVFVTSKLHHGGYGYSFRVRCQEEKEGLDLHVRAEVSGENTENVSHDLSVRIVNNPSD